MKLCAALLFLASFVYADNIVPGANSAYGYISNYGIPRAQQIRQTEETQARIVGGVPASLGQYPFFGGLLGDVIGINGTAVCGSSLLSTTRAVTAAHCWSDGINQIWRFTVVLGSTTLFSGGTRIQSSVVAMHPNWSPSLARNDIAVIYLPNPVTLSAAISPVAMPSGLELGEDFAGNAAVAAGFGITSAGQISQVLNHVSLNVIANSACSLAFPFIIQNTNICTSGLGGNNICSGDSGGPLVINRDGRQVLIGVSSFVSVLGCESNLPGVYARVTSFVDFLQSHL